VVLDPHNYAKRRLAAEGWKTEHLIGSREVPAAAFAEFWARLAKAFSFDDRIIFGLMNEPTGIAAEAWLGIVNPTLAAIRQTGAANLVLVPGVEYTGAHSWLRVGNQAMARVVDPGARFAFEVHQYFDGNSSGTHPDAVSATIGSERIKDFQLWARRSGFRAFLGEFNGGRNPTSYKALDDICREMNANQDVWLGWAAWAGGPRWPPDDMFNLEPWPDGRMREQTAILRRYAVGG
jgi:endoglucanase